MSSVGDQVVDGADQPFAGVEQVGEGVLDGTAAGFSLRVINLAVGRAKRGKVLTAGGNQLDRAAESAATDGVAHGGQGGVTAVDIADGNDQAALLDAEPQAAGVFESGAQRFFDEQVNPGVGQALGHGHVQGGRRGDDGDFG